MEEVRTLQQIVREDRVDDLIAAIKGGLNVNTVYPNVGTALHFACEGGGREKCLDLLLKHEEIDVNLRNGANQTPLHIAIYTATTTTLNTDAIETIKHLLKSWINVNQQDGSGRTPLHIAISGKHNVVNIVKTILSADAIDINRQDKEGRTPLFLAIQEGKTEIVQVLLDHGAAMSECIVDVTKIKQTFFTPALQKMAIMPINLAKLLGHHEIVGMLLQHVSAPLLTHLDKPRYFMSYF